MSGVSTRVWLLLTALLTADLVWSAVRDITITEWWPLAMVGVALLAVAIFYRRAGAGPRLAAIAEWTLLWIIFSVAGALLTYLAAAHDGPLYDARMAAADRALGFDWNAWYAFVTGHPLVQGAFALVYHSLVPQILFSVCWFSCLGWEQRNAELLTNVTLALVLATAVFWLVPTLGPCVGVPAFRGAYVDDLLSLRNGTLPSFDIMLLKGVVAFPSFHAVLATLFTYAHRRSPTLIPVAAFNAIMLLSLPSEGGHHLVDVLGGIAVAVIALLATRALPAPGPALAPARTAA